MKFTFTRIYATLVFILIKVAADHDLALEEFEGNVYLANVYDRPADSGVLKVYTQGEWNLVCYRMNGEVVTNNAAAATACRQAGHLTVLVGGLKPTECKNEVGNQCAPRKAISGIRCPEVADYSSTGELFLLRCDSQEETVNKTNCDDFAEVDCDSNDPRPYNGRIQISEENMLMIYFEEDLRPVCMHKTIAEEVADSACRQLGFTNATKFQPYTKKNVTSWKINDASLCGTKSNNISFACFTDCINKTAGYVAVDSCENDYSLFTIYCEFNKGNDGVYSGGNEIICTYHNDQTAECYDFSGVITATIVLSIITLILICSAIVLIPFAVYGCYKLRVLVRRPAERQADGERVPFAHHQNQNIAGGGINDENNDA